VKIKIVYVIEETEI